MNNGGGIAESRLHWFATNRLEAMRACQLDLSCGQDSGRAGLLGALQQIESAPSNSPTSPRLTLHFASWDQERCERALRHSGSPEWDTEPSIGSPIEFDLSAIQPQGIPLDSEVLAEKLWDALIYQASSATPTSVRRSWAVEFVRKSLQKTIELSPETFTPQQRHHHLALIPAEAHSQGNPISSLSSWEAWIPFKPIPNGFEKN